MSGLFEVVIFVTKVASGNPSLKQFRHTSFLGRHALVSLDRKRYRDSFSDILNPKLGWMILAILHALLKCMRNLSMDQYLIQIISKTVSSLERKLQQ
jgi:hypothetical protein